jgi:hypothetical protein
MTDGGGEWRALLSIQHGIVSRGQARRAGWSDRQIGHRLKSGRWQRVYPHTFATFSGPLTRAGRLWAAVLWAGEGAVLSHETAAEIHGITERPAGGGIHVTVPARRRPGQLRAVRGIVVHRRDRGRDELAGPFALPRTSIEDTVLDLATNASTFDLAYSWISRAVSRQLVTPGRLRAALASRPRARWRSWLADALTDADADSHSSLERRYVADVDRAHGLPRSRLQAGRVLNGKRHYRDCWYAEYRVAVEIDGPAYHRYEQVQADKDRDNANLALDDVQTFRFGPVAVTEKVCQTAGMVAATLQRNGWTGRPRACRRTNCTVRG